MEQIKINKTYFKLQGESNFPSKNFSSKNPTPTRNKVSNSGMDYDTGNMSYEDYQKMKWEQKRREHFKRYTEGAQTEKAQLSEDVKKLENIAEALQKGDFGEDSLEKKEAQNFVAKFKKRWYK